MGRKSASPMILTLYLLIKELPPFADTRKTSYWDATLNEVPLDYSSDDGSQLSPKPIHPRHTTAISSCTLQKMTNIFKDYNQVAHNHRSCYSIL